MVLAMSPAGDTLRLRCRNFPGLISSTQIDWFFPWPEDALVSVADYYLKEEELPEENREEIVKHTVEVHTSVQMYSNLFEMQLKRKNFSTPKNYLDFLNNYRTSLSKYKQKFIDMAKRYKDGLEKLAEAKGQIEHLREDLEVKQTEVNTEKGEVAAILEEIMVKEARTLENKAKADEKKRSLDRESAEIEVQTKRAAEILVEAQPEV